MSKQEFLDKLSRVVIKGDEEKAGKIAQEVLDAGIDPLEAINEGAVKGMDELGERYSKLEAYLPDLMLAGDAMKAILKVLVPHIKDGDESGSISVKVVIGL